MKLQHLSLWLLLLGLFSGGGSSTLAQTPFDQAKRNKEGPFVKLVRHNDGSRTVTSRDEVMNDQILTTYGPDGEIKLIRKYQLDRYGRSTTFTIYDGNERPLLQGEYGYDSSSRLIEESLWELPSGDPIRILSQGYDASGRKMMPNNRYYKELPEAILYWMDPDSRGESEEPGKRTIKVPLFQRNRPGVGSQSAESGESREEKKGMFKKLFNRN
ncbi:MAG: hypothetical protein AAF191_04630 [Verrucomicrobiota bacterium]